MKVSKIVTAIALLGMAAPALAQSADSAAAVGHVATATDGVFISRAGKLIPASAGQAVFKGDRVVTRAKANAKIAMANCNVSLGSTSIVSVSSSCNAPETLAASSTGMQGANGFVHGGEAWLIALLAAAAVGTGAYFAATNSTSTPASH